MVTRNDLKAEIADAITRGYCPDCGRRGFVLGPQGGNAINIECANIKCRSRFNVALFGGKVMFAHRIDSDNKWPSEP
jgi:hypothetical protein